MDGPQQSLPGVGVLPVINDNTAKVVEPPGTLFAGALIFARDSTVGSSVDVANGI